MNTGEDSTYQPYEGLRVLDMSQGLAGPYCAEILLQNGASVIKVEPIGGDWARGLGKSGGGMTPTSVANNYGKRSICIDLSVEAGHKLLIDMVKQSDLLIESFRPDVMPRLGLSYEDVSKINPKLVYLSINGFGSNGPSALRPATDSVLQALTGMMAENRDSAGVPRKFGLISIIDASTGVYAAQAAGAALYRQAVEGIGTYLNISLLHSAVAIQSGCVLRSYAGGDQAGAPKGLFESSDGYVNIFTVHDKMFTNLSHALGHAEWAADSHFSTGRSRSVNAEEITRLVAAILKENTSEHWERQLSQHDVICASVNDYAAMLKHEQVQHARLFELLQQPGFGEVPASRVPGADPHIPLRPSPFAGADTRAVLEELGLEDTAIDDLVLRRVVGEYHAKPE